MYHVLVQTVVNRFSGNPAAAGLSPCFRLKLFEHLQSRTRLKGLLSSFFALLDFFREISNVSKGSFFIFFRFFLTNWSFKKPKGFLFHNFENFTQFFELVLIEGLSRPRFLRETKRNERLSALYDILQNIKKI